MSKYEHLTYKETIADIDQRIAALEAAQKNTIEKLENPLLSVRLKIAAQEAKTKALPANTNKAAPHLYPANRSKDTDRQLWDALNDIFLITTDGAIDPYAYCTATYVANGLDHNFDELFCDGFPSKNGCYISAFNRFLRYMTAKGLATPVFEQVLKWRKGPELRQNQDGSWGYYMRLAIAEQQVGKP